MEVIMADTRKLRVAIIGQGRSGRNIHGKYFKSEQNKNYQVVYVVEADAERRARAEEEYPCCKSLSHYTELYGKTDIDLVVNASYSDDHYPVTYDLISHGFNTLVEKPFARTRVECDTLIALAEQKKVTLAVFQQTFLAPLYTNAIKVIKDGTIGELLQASIHYSGFARRWDWQTIQSRMAGSIYNTGPHPIGIALGFLGFDPEAKLVYSKLACAMTSGDAEDYAKMIMTAPGKAVVDVEIMSTDTFNDYTINLVGTKGSYRSTTENYKMKYIVDGENPERPVIFESLKNDEGYPIYCSEKLVSHEESGALEGSAFESAVEAFYAQLYNKLVEGTPMSVTPEQAAQIISMIEQAHAENPLPVRYVSVNG